MIALDRDGNCLGSWGDGRLSSAHGITIGPDDLLYVTDRDQHPVRKFTPDGRLLMTLGTPHVPSDTGSSNVRYRDIQRAAGPFNCPTNLAIAPNGDLYVSDGYGNCRVHRFAADRTLKQSWGAPGTGPGEFHLVHGIAALGDGRVFVCDRENDRVQVFSPEGEYLSE